MMRKIFVIALLACMAYSASAQEYKKFKVGIGMGLGIPGGKNAKPGPLFYIEPSYRLNDVFSLGLKYESALLVRGATVDIDDTSMDIGAVGSFTLNSSYYFFTRKIRAFAGLGLGVYTIGAINLDEDILEGTGIDAESKFGLSPRIGFDLGHFNMSIDYNFVPTSSVKGSDVEFKNSYLGIRLGVSIGGGKK